MPTTIGIIAAAFINLGEVRHVMAQTKGSHWASAEAGACSCVEPPAPSVRRRTRSAGCGLNLIWRKKLRTFSGKFIHFSMVRRRLQ